MIVNILADTNIPGVRQAFGSLGQVAYLPGRAIRREHLKDVDVLLVRSVTEVNADLLQGTDVKFVGSATAGVDHIDHAYVDRYDIKFAHAPGANAASVAEYICAALLWLSVTRGRTLHELNLAVVGCGNVGTQVIRKVRGLALNILPCDPPLAETGRLPPTVDSTWYSWEEVLDMADILSLHVPLSHEGPYATSHLVDARALEAVKTDAWLINTSRGGVVASEALISALHIGRLAATVLDVWKHEPVVDPELMKLVDLSTPHIAGYSFDGKLKGTHMLYEAVMEWLNETPTWTPDDFFGDDRSVLQPPPAENNFEAQLDRLVRQMYDIRLDDANLRRIGDLPDKERGEAFSGLRKSYRKRRSFDAFGLPSSGVSSSVRNAFEIMAGYQSNG